VTGAYYSPVCWAFLSHPITTSLGTFDDLVAIDIVTLCKVCSKVIANSLVSEFLFGSYLKTVLAPYQNIQQLDLWQKFTWLEGLGEIGNRSQSQANVRIRTCRGEIFS
jgi:hypothetical protein